MDGPDEKLLRRLLPIFREEACERIASIASKMAEIGRAGGDDRQPLAEAIFREAHSLKAAARAVGRGEIEAICQALESVFAEAKRDKRALSEARLKTLAGAVETLEDIAAEIGTDPDERRLERAKTAVEAMAAALDAPVPAAVAAGARLAAATPEPPRGPTAPPAPPVAPPMPAEAETVRLSVALLSELMLHTEEMLAKKLSTRRLAGELALLGDAFADRKKEKGQAGDELEAQAAAARKTASSEAHDIGVKVDRMLGVMKAILRVPCASLLQQFPGIVRNLAREQGKDAAVVISGAELEVDRRILQEMSDPLLHLLRNSVDHGVEPPQERRAAGKDARASIVIAVNPRDGDKVELAISDDGGGISLAKLAETARRLGLIGHGEASPSEAELLPLIFHSGFSTRPSAGEISGRGLGLAIVREKVERLGGSIAVETAPGRGTEFRLVLPLSLAMYHGISVRVGDGRFVLPTFSTDRVARVRRSTVALEEGSCTVSIDGAAVPLVPLGEILELPRATATHGVVNEWLMLVLLGEGADCIALAVDDIEGDQEILMKPLGKCFARVRNVQGGAILPNGAIAPVLNVQDLRKSAGKILSAAGNAMPATDVRVAASKSVLIAEDSITARGLLKSLLEDAGYRVVAAADGMDAWAALQREAIDLLVSDIEMPRMNGLELTARIRRDKQLAKLPVILVTALESREDFERGMDAGANAYLAKGNFEEARLIESVRRFL